MGCGPLCETLKGRLEGMKKGTTQQEQVALKSTTERQTDHFNAQPMKGLKKIITLMKTSGALSCCACLNSTQRSWCSKVNKLRKVQKLLFET